MNARTLMEKLEPFKGEEWIDVVDEINRIALAHSYTINVIDPDAPGNLDQDFSRLNVRINKQFVITSFTIG